MAPPKGGYAPDLDKFLDALKSRPVDHSVDFLISLLKRRQIRGSEPCAIATAHVLLQVVARDRWNDVDQLIGRIQLVGRKLVSAQPHELVIGNVVKRALGLIRDEAEEDRNETGSDSQPDITPSLPPAITPAPVERQFRPLSLATLGSFARTQSMFNLLSDPDFIPSPSSTPKLGSNASTPLRHAQSTNIHALRSEVIDGIEEMMDEIRQVDEQVQAYAEITIHPGDYVLVYQPSRTVQKFLTRAASKRKFTLFLVVDPSTASNTEDPYASLRKSLSSGGSTVISIMNIGLAAYMSKVNKVILGARAITRKGGVIVDSGAAAIAHAAREQGRPVIVLGGVYKLSPDHRAHHESLVEWGNPSKYVNFADGAMVGQVSVRNTVAEFVPTDLINTYITNLGAHSKDHLHGIIGDHYNDEDIGFDLFGKIQR
ncbi:nagb/rpia/CoA transferase-like protein [Annulohypoxylon maeteangense]|uniref:nagb/rpia/CoA transferase-like protein n=1 Tax=Annulohypoxylon maeteangense TaxID=1927788 RepID=UPI002007F6AD|nr:nagb/rpia/CoA transferase-like protein [Annulohypoxylon maeteangense]KAI0885569.1 nagb/rpia/CoA transferase-like protein [Annulohypoxylon maeteangense]